jgi:outer membrane protein assembly factor BamB
MSERTASRIITGIFILFGLFFLVWWLYSNPEIPLKIDVPGKDNKPASLVAMGASVNIGQYSQKSLGRASAIKGSWPRFRGVDFDNISKETVALSNDWGESPPKILWSVNLGEGHAAPAVINGRVYVLDYDERLRSDALRCLSLDDGQEIWRRWYPVILKRNHGMSRTVPAVNERYVVSMGPRCHVMCVDAASGDLKWGMDLEKDYGAKTPLWYTAQCPLIENDLAIIAPCGKDLMIGVDCETGRVLWHTPNSLGLSMSHSSIMPMTFHGTKMYVYCGIGGMVGVAADKGREGEVLWHTTAWNNAVIVPSPVIFPDGRIFLTAGYGAGSMMLQVTYNQGKFQVSPLFSHRPTQGLASEQQTPILYNGLLFAVLPKDAGPLRDQFVCYDPNKDEIVWASGRENRFGLGPFIIADGKIFILNDDGMLTILRVSFTAFEPLASGKIMDGTDAWGPLALAGGRLLLRDSTRLFCIDLKRDTGEDK